jgi:hypothetical protein
MSRRGERDRSKERFWRTMVRQWRQSDLSIRDFCAEHQLAEPNFYAWRRTIAQRDLEARRQRGHGERRRAKAAQAVFVPVHVTDLPGLPAVPALEVVFSRGRILRVPGGFDAVTLRQLLAVLEETPAC